MFSDSGSSYLHIDYLFTCLGLIVKLQINYFHDHVEFTKTYENHVNFEYFMAKFYFHHMVLNFVCGKPPPPPPYGL